MLVIFWHIDSHKAPYSKMNCKPLSLWKQELYISQMIVTAYAFVRWSIFAYSELRLCLNFLSFPFFSPADFELAQLQEKLRETELVMENIVSNAHHSPDRWVCAFSWQEWLVWLNLFVYLLNLITCAIIINKHDTPLK